MRTQFFAYLSTVCCQNKKTSSFVLIICILLLFGDTLLPVIGHCLHVVIEVVESILEHFLEATFGMTERQAQITLFYSAVLIIARLSWYLARKAYFAACDLYEVAQMRWRLIKTSPWFKTLLMFGAIGTTFYIFS